MARQKTMYRTVAS